mgnify:CR=1 FL=1
MEVFIQGVTDNSSSLGGWCFLLNFSDGETCQMGSSYEVTTASYMTLVAASKALAYLNENNSIGPTIFTDSKFVFDGITKMVPSWIDNDWKTSSGKQVKHKDLWEYIHCMTQDLHLSWSFTSANNKPLLKALLLASECSTKSQYV